MNIISEEYAIDQAAACSVQSEAVVSVRGLVKCYGSHAAVADIDLEARRGEIFAFRCPNGVGKTTTVEILEGFRPRTKGQVVSLGTIRPRGRRTRGAPRPSGNPGASGHGRAERLCRPRCMSR